MKFESAILKLLLIIILPLLYLNGCGSNKDFEGNYVKLIKASPSYNIYFFDFNDTLLITKNSDSFIVNRSGNKLKANLKKETLYLNNNSIIFRDVKNNSLLMSISNGNRTETIEYWPRYKAKKYLQETLSRRNYRRYLENVLLSQNLFLLNDNNKSWTESEKEKLKENRKDNPFYPYIALGDFNGDNKIPDMAIVVGKGIQNNSPVPAFSQSLIVLFAEGNKRYLPRRSGSFDILTTIPKKELNMNLDSRGSLYRSENSDGIQVYSFSQMFSDVYYWNGYTFQKVQIGD